MAVQVSPSRIDIVLATLGKGECIGMPTETVYGLAADASNGEAVAGIFEMKGRPRFNPLIAHVSDQGMAERYGVFSEAARKLANAFWPGPLTLVLPLKQGSTIHPLVTAGLGTIGLRCPQGIAHDIIDAFGRPLAAPSANRSGRISPTRSSHVMAEFENTSLVVIDGPDCDHGIESTIAKIANAQITILRPGSVTADMIKQVTGIKPSFHSGDDIQAPGMMKSHYAPEAQLILNQNDAPEAAGLLAFGPQSNGSHSGPFYNLSERGDLREAAANLYDGMKTLDAANIGTIHVQPIPRDGLGLAINDRLNRAAAPREGSEK